LLVVFKPLIGGYTIEIADVTKEQVIMLAEEKKPENVNSLYITITGNIDGSATIQRSYKDKKMYNPEMISGKVNLRLGSDWYDDKCLIIYTPSDVVSGSLKIRYKFDTF